LVAGKNIVIEGNTISALAEPYDDTPVRTSVESLTSWLTDVSGEVDDSLLVIAAALLELHRQAVW
jgi:hypothetical protein